MKSDHPNTIIRLARQEDAPEIADVHIMSWQETYRGLISDDYLSQLPMTIQNRTKTWAKLIAEKKPGQEYWVVEGKRHRIVGFAATTPARDEKFSGAGELSSIYLLKHYQRQGIGYALLIKALRHLKSCNFTSSYCWVLKDNPTIDFYLKTGGRLSGDSKVDERPTVRLNELAIVWDDLSLF